MASREIPALFLCHVDEERFDALVTNIFPQRDGDAAESAHQFPIVFRPWAADDAIFFVWTRH